MTELVLIPLKLIIECLIWFHRKYIPTTVFICVTASSTVIHHNKLVICMFLGYILLHIPSRYNDPHGFISWDAAFLWCWLTGNGTWDTVLLRKRWLLSPAICPGNRTCTSKTSVGWISLWYYSDAIMRAMASQITGVYLFWSTVGPGAD